MAKSVASPGDSVKVCYDDKEVTGMLMPRVEALSGDVTVIKLENGYNIGINNSRVKGMTVIKKYEKPAAKKEAKAARNPKLPTVAVLSFGGTISSKIDYRTGGVYAHYTAEDFIAMEPDLAKVANIHAEHVFSKMSEDIAWDDWREMAKAIERFINRDDVAGVVATVGTDTFHFITAAMAFSFPKLTKPIVFTASQRSIDRGSSDAFMNLRCAVQAAATFDGAEVMSCMHATTNDDHCFLIRGTKLRKMHTSRRDAFRPINEKPLAKVHRDGTIEVVNANYVKRNAGKSIVDGSFEKKVAIILAYPGNDSGIIDYYLSKGYKGIVISATAFGHVATEGDYALIPGIKKAVSKGVPIIITSQTIYGRVHPHVYTNLRKLSIGAGAIFVEDMLTEVAYIKLGYVLGHTKEIKKAAELMLQNMHGEINMRHTADDFLY